MGRLGSPAVVGDMNHQRWLGFAVPRFGRAFRGGLAGKIVVGGGFLPLAF
jgi:hypothetical protein